MKCYLNRQLKSRHRVTSLLTAAGIALLGQACNGSGNAANPPNTTSRVTGPAWTITLKSACDDGTDPTNCVAYYGFSVDADGNYKLGPSPENHTKVDKLSDSDRNAISDAIKPFLGVNRSQASAGQTCTDVDPSDPNAPISTDTVTLTRLGGQPQTIISADPSKICTTDATEDQAHTLYAAIETAAQTDYALPFPDACIDAAGSVSALYDSLNLRACNADSDCAYIASDFTAIPADTEQFVATDDCSQVTPLVVANAATVAAQQQALNSALNSAETTCGDRMWRSDCLNQQGFLSDTGAPVCNNHVCTKNPAAHSL